MDRIELLAGLIEAMLVSSAAIVLVLVLRGPLRRRSGAGVAYALWALVPVACVAMLLPAPVREVSLLATPVAFTITALQVGTVAASRDLTPLWLGLWLLGVAAMAGGLWLQQCRFERGLGSLQAVDAGARVLQAQSCAGLPALVGLLRPRIVLPADHATRYDSEQRALLLAHERVHLHRGDAWINALVAVARAIFWCNPLVHLAAGRLRHDQELACDERVIAARPQSRRAYADAMLNTLMSHQPVPLGCQWGLTHPIKERIMMLKQDRPSRRVRLAGLALVGVAACASGFAVWAAQPSQVQALPTLPGAQQAITQQATVETSSRMTNPPIYPESLVKQGIGGTVVLIVDVAADGRMTGSRIDRSSGDEKLDDAAQAAAASWKFIPAINHGKAVASQVRVPIEFKLDGYLGDAVLEDGVIKTEVGDFKVRDRTAPPKG